MLTKAKRAVSKSLIFKGPLVLSIIADRKTKTRRLVDAKLDEGFSIRKLKCGNLFKFDNCNRNLGIIKCPWNVGDKVWIRETVCIAPKFFAAPDDSCLIDYEGDPRHVSYRADGHSEEAMRSYGLNWTPAIHCPRWVSRVSIELTEVHAEQLGDITDSDAIAEGIESTANGYRHRDYLTNRMDIVLPRYSFVTLWESIEGPGSWDPKIWVWVLGFKRLEDPERKFWGAAS